MAVVKLLEKTVAERIAAGEVVERPASIVKEMVENSLDAGAQHVTVEILSGGMKSIRISDDGCGMSSEDMAMAIQRFATSKISQIDDLNSLNTFGFRGEALPSIVAVSRVIIRSCQIAATEGAELYVEGAGIPIIKPCACPPGTIIEVSDLFYNTPARLKFMRSPVAETTAIIDLLGRMAIARPDVHFKLISNHREVFSLPIGMTTAQRLAKLWKIPDKTLVPISNERDGMFVDGYIALPSCSRNNRNQQLLLLNGRIIKSSNLAQAIQEGFSPLLPRGRFPVAMVRLLLSPDSFDVNVHPNKLEVRFVDTRPIFVLLYGAISRALEDFNADTVDERQLDYSVELSPKTQLDGQAQNEDTSWREALSPYKTMRSVAPEGGKVASSAVERASKCGSSAPNSDIDGEERGLLHIISRVDTVNRHQKAISPSDKALERREWMRRYLGDEPDANPHKEASAGSAALEPGNSGHIVSTADESSTQVLRLDKPAAVAMAMIAKMSEDVASTVDFDGNSTLALVSNPGREAVAVTDSSPASQKLNPYLEGFQPQIQQDVLLQDSDIPAPNLPTSRFQLFGQLHNTFIVGLVDGELWVIDQHTAHERINYEHLGRLAPLQNRSQALLVPEILEFSPVASEYLSQNSGELQQFGFEVEPFGRDTFQLRAIPCGLSPKRLLATFRDLIEELVSGAVSVKNSVGELAREKLRAMTSCKASVRAGDRLSPEDMCKLVDDLLQVEHSRYCPHGRPTRIKLDKVTLERLFHRT